MSSAHFLTGPQKAAGIDKVIVWTSAGTEHWKLGTFISNPAQLCWSSAWLLRPSTLYGTVRTGQNLHCLRVAHWSGARENRGRGAPLPPAESGGLVNERGLNGLPFAPATHLCNPSPNLHPHPPIDRQMSQEVNAILIERRHTQNSPAQESAHAGAWQGSASRL